MLKRQPSPCPNHPESQLVRTDVRTESEMAMPAIRQKLTQHICGVPGCREGTGWLYEGRYGLVREGPGRCEDPDVIKSLDTARQEDRTSETGFLVVAGWVGITILGICACWITTNEGWTIAHTVVSGAITAASAPVMALCWRRSRRKKRSLEAKPGMPLW